jgi:hypothetical protein
MADKIVTVASVNGMIEAEIFHGLLESNGVKVWLSHEAAGTAIGINIAPLGTVDIMVQEKDLERARQVLEDYRAGRLENGEAADSDDGEG